MTLLAQNEAKMQQLMNAVQEFEAWSGIHVNTTKTKLMTIDGIAANRTDAVMVTYRDEPLIPTSESEAVRYLSFWVTPNGNMKAAMDLVFERTIKGDNSRAPIRPETNNRGFCGESSRQLSIPSDGTLEKERPRQAGSPMETRVQDSMETQRKHSKSPMDITKRHGGSFWLHIPDVKSAAPSISVSSAQSFLVLPVVPMPPVVSARCGILGPAFQVPL
jgi:hypothetical protein